MPNTFEHMRRGERPGRSINSIRHRQQRIVDETRAAPGLSDDSGGQTQHRGASGHNSRCVAILKPQRKDSQNIRPCQSSERTIQHLLATYAAFKRTPIG